jgi:DNA repair exonuclease SbcCD nuclease subunit
LKFIHTSDWQLGMTRAFLTDEASARFSQARIDAVRRLGELAGEHGASFIVVAGDVFESSQLSRETLLRTLDALKSLPVPVFLLPGNHDPLDGASIFNTREFVRAPDHVIVIRDLAPIPVPGLDGVEVVGAPWKSKRPTSDLCADLAGSLPPAAGVLRVAVCHGQVDTLSPDKDRPEIIDLARAELAIRQHRFHYLGLGDRHSLTDVGNTGRIRYSGAPVATDFTETDPNQALLVDLDVESCTATPLAVGDWHFIEGQRAMNGEADLEDFRDWLDRLPAKERTAVKVGFEGSVNLATAAALDELMDTNAELFASLRRRERTTDLAIVPDELDEDSVALSGYAKATWNELLDAAGRGDAVARDALMLLYRLGHREA